MRGVQWLFCDLALHSAHSDSRMWHAPLSALQGWVPCLTHATVLAAHVPQTHDGCVAALLSRVGAQVYRASQMGYWRASKRWCKQLPAEAVGKALAIFANNEAGLQPSDVYGGPSGAIAQLQQLAAWFQVGWLRILASGAPRNSLAATARCLGMQGGKPWGPPLCP